MGGLRRSGLSDAARQEEEAGFAAVGFMLAIATARVVLSRYLSTRATYIHIGALFGTIR